MEYGLVGRCQKSYSWLHTVSPPRPYSHRVIGACHRPYIFPLPTLVTQHSLQETRVYEWVYTLLEGKSTKPVYDRKEIKSSLRISSLPQLTYLQGRSSFVRTEYKNTVEFGDVHSQGRQILEDLEDHIQVEEWTETCLCHWVEEWGMENPRFGVLSLSLSVTTKIIKT